MRALLPLLAAALLLPIAAPAHAQAPTGGSGDHPVRVLEDRQGDVRLTVAGQPEDPAGRWAAADLLALDVRETSDDFTFTLKVASLKASPEAPLAESTQYTIGFLHRDREFAIELFRTVLTGPSYGAFLQAYDPALRRYDTLSGFGPVTVDADAGTMAVTFGRDLFTDHEGNAPHPEVPFTGWHAASVGGFDFGGGQDCIGNTCFPSPGATARDYMPDQGNGTTDLPIRYGIVQSGLARLGSDTPTRASNGEATTIVYEVTGLNRMPGNESFQLAASGVPAGWQVQLPADRITIPGNGSVLFPVLVTVPFAHQHGTYQKFLLEMRSVRDSNSVGRIQLGIRYTQPPQPAGHHNVLWLHSETFTSDPVLANAVPLLGGTVHGLYMNAAAPEEDPIDAKIDVEGQFARQDAVPPVATYLWPIPLAPALELGLDVRQGGQGNLTVPLKTTLPMPATTLGGHLVYVPPPSPDAPFFGDNSASDVVLADVVPAAPVDLAPNTAGNVLHATIVPHPGAGYLPFQKGAGLRFDLTVSFTRVDGAGGNFGPHASPLVQPGGILDLPLNEYHDRVAQVFQSNGTLRLRAASAQDRATNPGKTVLFNFTLADQGAAPRLVDLELTGTHLAWASLLPAAQQVRLQPNETRDIYVVVKVPSDADKGDTADLVLSATSVADLNVRSLARLYATVETGKQDRDDAGLVAALSGAGKKKAAGPEPPLVALALLALALAARRRR